MNLQELLNKWNIKCDVNTLLSMWNESHRSYHTLNHLNDVIDQINESKSKYSDKEYEKLMITALFHDCVYDPMKSDNEEKSADFFMECCSDKSNSDVLEVKQMILDTKTHQATTNLSESFNHYDMSIVERDFDQLLEWENGIHEEFMDRIYYVYDHDINFFKDWAKENGYLCKWDQSAKTEMLFDEGTGEPVKKYKAYGELYKEGRLKFLESLLDKYTHNTDNLLKLIDWVKNNY